MALIIRHPDSQIRAAGAYEAAQGPAPVHPAPQERSRRGNHSSHYYVNNNNGHFGRLINTGSRDGRLQVCVTPPGGGEGELRGVGGGATSVKTGMLMLSCHRHAAHKVPWRSVTAHSSHFSRACPCHTPGCRSQTWFPSRHLSWVLQSRVSADAAALFWCLF